MYRVGEKMLCKHGYSTLFSFSKEKEYKILSMNAGILVVRDDNGRNVSLFFSHALTTYFYTKDEHRRIKIDKLLASV